MNVREIVLVSGKGGTGKTTLTACFAALAEERRVMADADVDTPNLSLLLSPKETEHRPFFGMDVAHVDASRCTGCGECERFCRFRSIFVENNKARVDPAFCEGCGGCLLVCPEGCISKEKFQRGVLRRGETEFGPMWYARLAPGGENSGLLVALLRKEARREAVEKGIPLLIVDGPPGVGCPVISSLTGASFSVLVTEPSLSALSDLRRAASLCRMLSVPFGVVINRWNLSGELADEIRRTCDKEQWLYLGAVPFSEGAARAVNAGRIPVQELGEPILALWASVLRKGCGI